MWLAAGFLIPLASAVTEGEFDCVGGQYCRTRSIAEVIYDTEAKVEELCWLQPRCYAYDFNTVGGYGRLRCI